MGGALILLCVGILYYSWEGRGSIKIAGIEKSALIVSNLVELRDFDATRLASGAQMFVQGFYIPGDAGGGNFLWLVDTALVEDGGTIIRSNRSDGHWVRVRSDDLNVRWFGAKGDGVSSDHEAFVKALVAAAGHRLRIPAGTYLLDGETTIIAPHTLLEGEGRVSTTLSHRSNSDMFILSEGVSIVNLGFDGNGSTQRGGCMIVKGTSGRQSLLGVRAVNFDGPVIYFECTAGSQFSASDCQFSRTNARSGSERYAVVIDPTKQLTAVPRKFTHIETNGQCAFDFGGCNDVFVCSSFLGDLKYTADSRGVLVTNSRVANQATLTLSGHNNTLVGCDLAPQVILARNADNCVVGPSSYNASTVIDRSGNGRNLVYLAEQMYEPVLTNAGNDARLGNGVLRGSYSRQGAVIFATIELIVGSETYLGNTGLRLSLPMTAMDGLVQYPGQAVMTHERSQYAAVAQIVEEKNFLVLIREGTGIVTGRSPVVWAAGDIIRVSVAYQL